MKTKSYTNGQVTYGYSIISKGWEFVVPGLRIIRHCKGAEVAHKVASVIQGGLVRNGSVDGLAHYHINRLTVR